MAASPASKPSTCHPRCITAIAQASLSGSGVVCVPLLYYCLGPGQQSLPSMCVCCYVSVQVVLMGHELVLWKQPGDNGTWSCFDNACPHRCDMPQCLLDNQVYLQSPWVWRVGTSASSAVQWVPLGKVHTCPHVDAPSGGTCHISVAQAYVQVQTYPVCFPSGCAGQRPCRRGVWTPAQAACSVATMDGSSTQMGGAQVRLWYGRWGCVAAALLPYCAKQSLLRQYRACNLGSVTVTDQGV